MIFAVLVLSSKDFDFDFFLQLVAGVVIAMYIAYTNIKQTQLLERKTFSKTTKETNESKSN